MHRFCSPSSGLRLLRCISTEANPTPSLDPKDVFGTLSDSGKKNLAVRSAESFIKEDSDGYDKEEIDFSPRKNAYYYKYEISKHARQGATGIRKALELFQEMKAKARLEPTVDNFSPLIYGCSRAGYTKRAFELFEESFKYLGKPTNSTVTCLINACGESPFPEYGLKRLDWLRTFLKVNFPHRPFNEIHYNSAIKAYGKLQRLDEAAKIFVEMIDNGIYPDSSTFCMLLIGCASNRESGAAVALRMFKIMKMYDIKPTVYNYNLLLRCIRDCGMGTPNLIQKIFDDLPALTAIDQRIMNMKRNDKFPSGGRKNSDFVWAPKINNLGKYISAAVSDILESTPQIVTNQVESNQQESQERKDRNLFAISSGDLSLTPALESDSQELPNLLSGDHLTILSQVKAIQVDRLNNPRTRFLLFGGFRGFLRTMELDNCQPDSRTFSLLLKLMESTQETYREYFEIARQFNIKRDQLFYDLLIKEICSNYYLRNRLELGLYLIEQMQLDNLKPNIMTFEGLAYGCHTWKEAHQLVNDVRDCGFVVSNVMIGRMFFIATKGKNFKYLAELIDLSVENGFKPTKSLLDNLEDLRLEVNNIIAEQEKESTQDSNPAYSDWAIRNFDKFSTRFNKWLREVELLEEDHPWSQFEVDTKSRKDGFYRYVEHFKALEKAKQEAIESGKEFGNLTLKARHSANEKAEKLESAAIARSS